MQVIGQNHKKVREKIQIIKTVSRVAKMVELFGKDFKF